MLPEPLDWLFYLEIQQVGCNPSKRCKEMNKVGRLEATEQYHIMPAQRIKDPLETYEKLETTKTGRAVKFKRGTQDEERVAYNRMAKVLVYCKEFFLDNLI